MRVRNILKAACAAACLVLATTSGTTPASAEPAPVALPLTQVRVGQARAMVYARGHLFVSTGNEVRVLDERGRLRKRLRHLPEATGLVASSDGARVYAALRASNRVAVIDTRRLRVLKTFRVDPCPEQVALAGSRLFYATGSCDSPHADPRVASIDPVRGGPPVLGDDAFVPDPALLLGAGSTLVVTSAFASEAEIRSYRVSGTELAPQARRVEAGYVWDAALSPDGATLYVTRADPGVGAYPTSTLGAPLGYPVAQDTARALAVSPDGSSFAVGTDGLGPDLLGFQVGKSQPTWAGRAAWEGSARPEVVGHTLSWSADSTTVFALLASADLRAWYLVAARV